jgi:hypothetical protein
MAQPRSSVVEGRANLARPSLRLLLFVTSLLLAAATAPGAEAAPLKPTLIGTNPGSPGASLTPLIQGRADGSINTVVRFATRRRGPVAMTLEPDATVTIYAEDSTCLNAAAIAAEGSVEEFEGSGVAVTVAPDSTTTFYASVTDDTGTSPCSTDTVVYRQVSAPPGAPVFDSVAPESPADDNFPHLLGGADTESTVQIYANPACLGQPLASGSAASFESPGIQVSVPDNTETVFFARAAWGGFSSPCSGLGIEYMEVTPASPPASPPATPPSPGSGPGNGAAPSSGPPAPPSLRTTPKGIANDNTPLVSGSAPGAASVRIFTDASCDGVPVVKGSAAQFDAGLEVQVVDNAAVAFYGVSVAPNGAQSRCSAPVYYVEDSTIPHTRITMGPAAKTRKRSAVFRFTDTTEITPGTTFFCRVDRAKWRQCSSPMRLSRLRVRRYVVQVRAVDLAGNAETKAAKRRFKVVPRP